MRIYIDQVIEQMKREETVVLNVLPKSEFRKLHIKGSENHPLKEDTAAFSSEVEEKYGRKKQFIVYGDHFGLLDSFFAARVLEDHGLNVRNYSGGIQEWHRAGLPVGGTDVGVEPVSAG